MKKFFMNFVGVLCGLVTMLLMVISIITPEKTKYDEYTDPFKYWTDDVYFRENFGKEVYHE